MIYAVRIRDTVTGVELQCDMPGDYDEGAEYAWSEGNYSCDCNRALFFMRAEGGLSESEMPFTPCGEGRYEATIIVPVNLDTIEITVGFTPPDAPSDLSRP